MKEEKPKEIVPQTVGEKPKEIVPQISPKNDVLIRITSRNDFFKVTVEKKSTISEIASEMDELIESILQSKKFVSKPIESPHPRIPEEPHKHDTADPVKSFAEGIDVDPEKFSKLKLIAIKGDDVQILKPTKISARDGGLLLLAINEYVFNQLKTPYKEWKELCEASHLKSNTPIYQIAGDIKRGGYIDKNTYDNSDDKEMKLKPNAIELLRKVIEKMFED